MAGDERHGPFNNPFADQARKLKRRLKRLRRDVEPRRAPSQASAPKEQTPPADPFRDAVRGAVPLAGDIRRVPKTGKPPPVVSPEPGLAEALAQTPFDLRFCEHFVRGRAVGVSRETLGRLERGEFSVSEHVDLHGMTLEDAKLSVDEFLAECHREGHRCVLVITGKGLNSPGHVSVLREQIPRWLARGPSARLVLAFVTARECDGGIGALYVLLRKHSSRKNRIDVESGVGR